ncbi:hypothetical protein BH20CHL4_BH20CHL4_07110 [soil metagenome]
MEGYSVSVVGAAPCARAWDRGSTTVVIKPNVALWLAGHRPSQGAAAPADDGPARVAAATAGAGC